MKTRRNIFSVLVLIVCLLLSITALAQEKPLVEIDLYTVNDFHGALRAEGDSPGAAKLSGVLQQVGQNNPLGSVFLAGGDMLKGTIDADSYTGMPVVYTMNQMGFAANVIGNHAFDYPPATLQKQLAAAQFACLSSNITGLANIKPYVLLNRNGVKIAVIGLTTLETLTKSAANHRTGLQFLDLVGSAQKYIAEAKGQGAQIIVLLTHVGSFEENGAISGEITSLLDQVTGVDAVVTGHTHQVVQGEYKGVPVVQAGKNGEYVGQIHLLYSRLEKKVIAHNVKTIKVAAFPSNIDAAVTKTLEPIFQDVDKKYGTLLANNVRPLANNRYGESPLGDFLTDLLRQGFGGDVAFINAGAIRRELSAGAVSLRSLNNSYPFEGEVYATQLSGAQILELLAGGIFNNTNSRLRFAGIEVEAEQVGEHANILACRFKDGSQLEPNKIYKVITNDFLINGGDGYTTFTQGAGTKVVGASIQEFFSFALRAMGTINYEQDKRLVIAN